jgi:Asp-tRNA(Asn)/Glu-tRNA(Gln) amidotransferase A subunit family amidase
MLSAARAGRMLATGELTSEELTGACLARITDREPAVRAWAHIEPELAISQARRADARSFSGPLHGVPVGIKDVIDTADMPTAMGSPIYAGRRPSRDAACVAALRRAGAVIMGKTVTTEFACFQPGPTRNPINPGHTPGGSSSGSAAAVSDGMVPLALGTQTAGSIARPASYCGTVGYVSSRGAFPLDGIKGLCPSLDSLGVLARSVEDVQLMRQVLTGARYRPATVRSAGSPPATPSLESILVGLVPGEQITDIAPAMRAVINAVAGRLADARVHVDTADFSLGISELVTAHEQIMCFEAARSLAHELQFRELISDSLLEMLEAGNRMTVEQHQTAKAAAQKARAMIDEVYTRFDVLLAPAAPGPALQGLASTGSPVLSRPWQLAGLPVVVLPAGQDEEGLPLGIQLIGQPDRDDQLLEIAGAIATGVI